MEQRESDVFSSDAAQEFKRKDLASHYDRCAKTGRYIRDDKGIVVTITSEKPVALSPRTKEVVNVVFRLSEKALRQLIGSSGSVLKKKYALQESEVRDGKYTSQPVKAEGVLIKRSAEDED